MKACYTVTRPRSVVVFALGLAVACSQLSYGAGPRQESEQARQILDDTGVRGGLIVHLGSGDGVLTAALRAGDGYLVHGLDADPASVAAAREHVRSLGLYGPVSVQHWTAHFLPYAGGVVNLLVTEDLGGVPAAEVMRVLCPGGVAYVKSHGTWSKTVKPQPEGTDEWTHYLHGPDNNAVAHDQVVSSPYHLQWVGGPKWARHHNHLASLSAMVSAGGRLFAIVDEGPVASIALEPQWSLVARDAFNGVVLWKKPVGPWEGHLRPFRSGPTELPRRLVAVADRVYVTLGYGKPLSALDAASGQVVRTYAQTEGTVEVVCHRGVLYVVAGQIDRDQYADALKQGSASPPPSEKRIHAIAAGTGELLWTKSDEDTRELLPTTLCVDDGRVFFHGLGHVICLDAASGEALWRAPRPVKTRRLSWSTPTLVVHEEVVLCADCAAGSPAEEPQQPDGLEWTATARPKRGDDSLGKLIAFSVTDGRRLWQCTTAQGYNSPADLFMADGLVWTSTVPNGTSTDFTEGRDPRTGEIKRRLDTAAAFTTTHHHRCYRNKATDRYILIGRTGTELIDLTGQPPERHNWVRGTCQYGMLPCNGLLYAPPHSCACYIQSKLTGFWALKGKAESGKRKAEDAPRLQHGGAYDTPLSAFGSPLSEDWPTYRHDAARSGRATSTVSTTLRPVWQRDLGSRLTSPVVAGGVLLAASVDTHTVHALDARTGAPHWSHTVDGRVDSPPTIYEGRVLFGSADGHVYCLRLADGERVWRFRAAPSDRRTVAFGQVESVWPVTGSVLVHQGTVYCTAGRSSYLDGGMVLYRLDPRTGKELGRRRFYSRDPQTGEQPEALTEDVEMPGALPDVLAADGENVFWRDMRLDREGRIQKADVPHLYSPVGFLDDAWWHRTYWILGTAVYGRASGWAVVGNYVPSGRILVTNKDSVYGFGRKKIASRDRGFKDVPLHLFRADRNVTPLPGRRRLKNNNVALREHFVPTKVNYDWSREIPLVVRAMVLSGDVLFAAGPEMTNGADAQEPLLDDNRGALLMAFSAQDGRELSRHRLDRQPAFDGLIAAGGRLYLTLTNGSFLCMGSER